MSSTGQWGSRIFGKDRVEWEQAVWQGKGKGKQDIWQGQRGSRVFGNVRAEGAGSLVMIGQRGSGIFGKDRTEGGNDLLHG